MDQSTLVALLAGVLQGIFEWLPISSEGNLTIFFTWLGKDPEVAVAFSLFLHAGTAVSAAAYYRGELRDLLTALPSWRPDSAFEGTRATLTFVVVATLASGVVGLAAYATLEEVIGALTGGAFVALIGLLLIATGILQRVADDFKIGEKEHPDLVDAVLVGALQGLAILPGVSRSGTTASTLLFRGHDGESSFRLSFLLSIPAAAGASVLILLDDGVPAIPPKAALLAVVTAAVVGYLTIDALMRVVERIAFWKVCVGLGALATFGGVLAVIVL